MLGCFASLSVVVRAGTPATYYCTHALAPLMFITDTRPVKVNGFVVPYDHVDRSNTLSGNRKDLASSIICRAIRSFFE